MVEIAITAPVELQKTIPSIELNDIFLAVLNIEQPQPGIFSGIIKLKLYNKELQVYDESFIDFPIENAIAEAKTNPLLLDALVAIRAYVVDRLQKKADSLSQENDLDQESGLSQT